MRVTKITPLMAGIELSSVVFLEFAGGKIVKDGQEASLGGGGSAAPGVVT
ncbi:hypothetical protein ACEQPO_14090 [Bacillus sp. SL00103]